MSATLMWLAVEVFSAIEAVVLASATAVGASFTLLTVERVGGAGSVGCAAHGRVINGHRHRIARLALEIERSASLEVEGVADDLEGGSIRSRQAQRIAAQRVVGDIDVGYLDVARG